MARRRSSEYRRQSQHALHTNIRLQKIGDKPTKAEVRDVMQSILDRGRVPKGWRFAMIEWTHAKSGTTGWREGSLSDLTGPFELVMNRLISSMRIGIDRAKSGGDVWEIEIATEGSG